MFNGLSEFMKGDGLIALSAIAAVLLIGAWKKSNWFEVGSVLLIYGIITSVVKGSEILSFVGKVLKLFGIDLGLN